MVVGVRVAITGVKVGKTAEGVDPAGIGAQPPAISEAAQASATAVFSADVLQVRVGLPRALITR